MDGGKMSYIRVTKKLELFCGTNFALGIDRGCSQGCVIVQLGWFGFAIIKGKCVDWMLTEC